MDDFGLDEGQPGTAIVAERPQNDRQRDAAEGGDRTAADPRDARLAGSDVPGAGLAGTDLAGADSFDAPPDEWNAVLDDLEARLASAEAGDLAALSGWSPPPGLHPTGDPARASALLRRQEAFAEVLRARRTSASEGLIAVRRQRRLRATISAPVYLDRLG